MIHANTIYDSDAHFVIDPLTRAIHTDSGKLVLIRGDHNSERYTFEIPRIVEGHDMSECSVVQIHYENLSKNKKVVNRDFYTVDDLEISSENDDTVLFSWLVSDASTQLVGTLRFSVRFECLADGGVREYVWSTTYFDKVLVNDCVYSTDSVLVEHSDFVSRVESIMHNIPTKLSQLDNDTGFLTEYKEEDPTVPDWAKAETKPTYTAEEVGALPDDTVIPSVATPDWNQNDEAAPDYIKNRPFYKLDYTTLLEETTISTDVQDGDYWKSATGFTGAINNFNGNDGNGNLTVIFDGVVYDNVSISSDYIGGGTYAVTIGGLPDYPFKIYIMYYSSTLYATESGNHTICVMDKSQPIIVKIPIDYLAIGDAIVSDDTRVPTVGAVYRSLEGFLSKYNNTKYVPSGNYNPATKKYVDDSKVTDDHINELINAAVPTDDHINELINAAVPTDDHINELIDAAVPTDDHINELINAAVPTDDHFNELINAAVPTDDHINELINSALGGD